MGNWEGKVVIGKPNVISEAALDIFIIGDYDIYKPFHINSFQLQILRFSLRIAHTWWFFNRHPTPFQYQKWDNTIRDGDSTALYTVNTVSTVYTIQNHPVSYWHKWKWFLGNRPGLRLKVPNNATLTKTIPLADLNSKSKRRKSIKGCFLKWQAKSPFFKLNPACQI